MCDFISWVELPEGQIAYLTDQEVFSKWGKERLGGCRHNDVLGHGAIRAYYGISKDRGLDREQRNFWDTSKLPEELAEKVRHFEEHWGDMWRKSFRGDDLLYIVEHAPGKWRRRAVRSLLMCGKEGVSCFELEVAQAELRFGVLKLLLIMAWYKRRWLKWG